jgi:hypothetical protein
MATQASPTTYTYRDLDRPESIRILVLYPAENFSAPIEGNLLHCDREQILTQGGDITHYEAVSYC